MQLPHLIDPSTVFWPYWVLFTVQVATLLALVLYVWKTWEMAQATRDAAEANREAAKANSESVAEAREARVAAQAPRMMLYFDTRSADVAEIVLENAGAGTAADIALTFDPRLRSSSTTWDPAIFFDTPKTLFPPRYRVVQMVDVWSNYISAGLPKRYDVCVTYRGVETGRVYTDTYVLDLSAFEHRSQLRLKGVHEVAKAAEDVGKILESSVRQLHSELQEVRAAQALEVESHGTAAQSLAELVALNRAVGLVIASPDTHAAGDQFRVALQRAAFRVVLAGGREGLSAQFKAAANEVFTHTHIPIWTRRETWTDEMGAKIATLENAPL